jgi:hypothetical protein
MKAASYGQNVRSCYVRNATTFSPAELFHLVTVSSAAVLGKQSEIGQLRKGFMADCALWDTRDLLPYRSKLPHQPSEFVSLLIFEAPDWKQPGHRWPVRWCGRRQKPEFRKLEVWKREEESASRPLIGSIAVSYDVSDESYE